MSAHEYDDDAVCIHCGFDGAEWWWWKTQTYEGKASDAMKPRCTAERETELARELKEARCS